MSSDAVHANTSVAVSGDGSVGHHAPADVNMSPMSDLTELQSSDPPDVDAGAVQDNTTMDSEDDDDVQITLDHVPPPHVFLGALGQAVVPTASSTASVPITASAPPMAASNTTLVPTGAAMTAAAATAAPQSRFSFATMNAMPAEVGIAYGVVPGAELTIPLGFLAGATKLYAVSYGLFVGVFKEHDMHSMAISGVSAAGHFSSKDCGAVVRWFNARLRMNLVRIAD
ncbi:hypothetical protein BD626DRAFT_570198 [Schizophyllum amplum]|uniref:Uncharacterized protein n=1 Tax=Schizophyllum amplum TaxID=97359 RepID=A0A550CB21_9AGAR|nr:hypothetical protein BD626DRAFT_570198 [Auriculariopsis ampla]